MFCFVHFDSSLKLRTLGRSSSKMLALHPRQLLIGSLLTCPSSNHSHGHIHSKGSRSRSVKVHRSIHTRDQPWHQQQQAQPQQISCHSSCSKGIHRICSRRSIQGRIHVHKSRTRGQLQPWRQRQVLAPPQQISCRSSRSKGSHHSNDVQVRNSLHKEDKGQPLDWQLP